MNTIFYKMRMGPEERGLIMTTRRFISIRETEHIHFCIDEWNAGRITALALPGETPLKTAKRIGFKTYRINKSGSRIAFATEQQAFDHLILLKKKQLHHMRRDIELVTAFLGEVNAKTVDDFQPDQLRTRVVPGTDELVSQYFTFD